MMFGIGTRKARLHVNSFTNLLGEDENGWGLSHKGKLVQDAAPDTSAHHLFIFRINLARWGCEAVLQSI